MQNFFKKAFFWQKIYLCIIFACIVVIFAFCINYISNSVVSRGVNEIELKDAENDLIVLHSIFNEAMISSRRHTFDWAVFDDTYNFIKYKDNRLISRGLNRMKMDKMNFIAAAIYDNEGKRLAFIDGSMLIYGEEWVDNEIQVFDRIIDIAVLNDIESIENFIYVKDVAQIFSIHKVYNSCKEGPSNGYIIMSIPIDKKFREQVYRTSGLEFSILSFDVYNKINNIDTKNNIEFVEFNDELHIYSVFEDFFNNPSFCIKIQKQRNIAAFGREISHKNFLLMLFLCISLFCTGFILLYLAQRRFFQYEIDYQNKHDNLTKLPNDLFFREKVSKCIKFIERWKTKLGVAFINVDNFRSINNCYGYSYGDIVLCEIANRLTQLAGKEYIARASSDNFLVLIIANSNKIIYKKTQRILSLLNKPFIINSDSIPVRVSIGIDFFKHPCDSISIIHNAELAKFNAKKRGGNTISVFNKKMKTAAFDKKMLEVALHEAVEKNFFTIHYQPKVDITKQEVVGCEALVRWQNSDGTLLPPTLFIPIAEKCGLITDIDMFVLRCACRQVVQWSHDGTGDVPVAVNMSVHSILSADFAERVIRVLEEEKTPPSLIDIEITESSFMSNMDKALAAISKLHDAGIHIALDDFGTGYSSLQYLSAMPISFLKIDKKFIDDIFSDKATAQPLVKSIISLATSLHMHTISEGVENINQLKFLAANGAHIIQGYLFSKPLNAIDCAHFLRHSKEHIQTIMHQAGIPERLA